MNDLETPAHFDHASEAPKPLPLSYSERAEIQRQGAKAAARGEPAGVNPLHRQRNRPPATGESADLWHERTTAWAQGHAAQTAARRQASSATPEGSAGEHE